MPAKTIWLMEDEADLLEWLELYEEARADVDAKYPRGDIQSNLAWSKMPRWMDQHLTLFELARMVKGYDR